MIAASAKEKYEDYTRERMQGGQEVYFAAGYSAAEAKTIPPALSSKGGGPLAVKPGGDPNQLVPQSQVYLVGINVEQPDEAIAPGSMAQVKIHCEYRSCAWWVWRTLSQTFDLGLAF